VKDALGAARRRRIFPAGATSEKQQTFQGKILK